MQRDADDDSEHSGGAEDLLDLDVIADKLDVRVPPTSIPSLCLPSNACDPLSLSLSLSFHS